AGVNAHTWTGWGSGTYWNAFVANLEMHGVGTFFDERLDNAQQFPIAARKRFGDVSNPRNDQITSKLAALQFSHPPLPPPPPPPPPPGAPRRLIRSGGCCARQGTLQRQGAVRDLSRAAALYGAGLERPHTGRDQDRRLPGQPRACLRHRRRAGEPGGRPRLPNSTAQGPVGPPEGWVLPRRPLRHARRRRQPLRQRVQPRPDAPGEARPGAVLALNLKGGVPTFPPGGAARLAAPPDHL